MIKVTKASMLTGKKHTLEIPCDTTQLNEWLRGIKPIQEAMPNVSAELREFLMTGITPEEWNEMVATPEGDE